MQEKSFSLIAKPPNYGVRPKDLPSNPVKVQGPSVSSGYIYLPRPAQGPYGLKGRAWFHKPVLSYFSFTMAEQDEWWRDESTVLETVGANTDSITYLHGRMIEETWENAIVIR